MPSKPALLLEAIPGGIVPRRCRELCEARVERARLVTRERRRGSLEALCFAVVLLVSGGLSAWRYDGGYLVAGSICAVIAAVALIFMLRACRRREEAVIELKRISNARRYLPPGTLEGASEERALEEAVHAWNLEHSIIARLHGEMPPPYGEINLLHALEGRLAELRNLLIARIEALSKTRPQAENGTADPA